MTVSQLSLYNGALLVIGEGKLASLTEEREARYLLDDAWDRGAVKACLEAGDWNFAQRTRRATYDPDVTPTFGFRYAFSKPTDWVRTSAISDDEYFGRSLTNYEYRDEAGYWWCDLQTIYISYVSDDAAYGTDYSLWPESFTDFVEHYLAAKIIPRVRQAASKREEVEARFEKARRDAMNKDALRDGAKFFPEASWARSRHGGRGGRGRGNRNRLIG